MLYYFLLYSKVNQLYIYIYPLSFRFFSHIGYYRVLSRVPCAISRSLLVTYFIYSSVYTSMSSPLVSYCRSTKCPPSSSRQAPSPGDHPDPFKIQILKNPKQSFYDYRRTCIQYYRIF